MLYLMVGDSLLLRALFAAALCLVAGWALGNVAIGWLRKRFLEPIKSISPTVVRLHQHKEQTPTMGGIFLLAGVLLGSLLCADLRKAEVLACLLAAIAFAAVGAVDDLVKLRTQHKGISPPWKLAAQFAAALPCALLLVSQQGGGLLEIGVAILVLMIGANAVNLTDGLDGLAAGCGAITGIAMTGMLWCSAASELSIVSAALTGALLAFLRFNRYPARVFMGDTGSQMIGAVLAICVLASGSLVAGAIYSGVFLIELVSVALQLASYRLRGRRVFLCAPIHHHFQFAGWPEPRIVHRFWFSAVLLAGVGLVVAGIQQGTARTTLRGENLAIAGRVRIRNVAASRTLEVTSVVGSPFNP